MCFPVPDHPVRENPGGGSSINVYLAQKLKKMALRHSEAIQ
jgi:hypothetical protein